GEVAVEERHGLDGGAGAEIEDGEQEQSSRSPDHEMVVDDDAPDERRHELEGRGGEHEQRDAGDPDAPGAQEARHVPGERAGAGIGGGSGDDQRAHRRAPSSATMGSAWSCALKMRAYRPAAAMSSV